MEDGIDSDAPGIRVGVPSLVGAALCLAVRLLWAYRGWTTGSPLDQVSSMGSTQALRDGRGVRYRPGSAPVLYSLEGRTHPAPREDCTFDEEKDAWLCGGTDLVPLPDWARRTETPVPPLDARAVP